MKAQVITVILFLVVSTTSCDEEASPIEVLYQRPPTFQRILREFIRFLESEYGDPPINPECGSNTESSTSTTTTASSTAQSNTPVESLTNRTRSKGGGHPHKETKNHHLHAKQHHKNEHKKHKQENHHERKHPHHPQQNY